MSIFEYQWWEEVYRQHFAKLWLAQAIILLLVGYLVASSFSSAKPPTPLQKIAADSSSSSGPNMWTCSMHPQIRSATKGDCPICGMDLIPVKQSAGGMRTLTLSPDSRALMSISTMPVERKFVSHEIEMVGKVDFDETKFGYISAWVPGRLDRLYVDYPGVTVKEGDHMVYIYSPELYAAQEELIQALKFQNVPQGPVRLPSVNLVETAREKLRLYGLTGEQISTIEGQAKPADHLTIYSPVGGVVIEKLKREGDYVKTGERIYTIADLNQVWLHLDAYESDLPWVRYGQDVVVTTEAYPGEEFHGRIAFIQPVLNDKTRTVKVRVNLPNANGKLKPEMFVHAKVRPIIAAGGRVVDPSLAGKWISPMHPEIVKDEPGLCDICKMPLVRAESLGYVSPGAEQEPPPLVIPYSAALVTGRRAIVYVELPVMPVGVDAAIQGVGAAVQGGNLEQIRSAFAVLGQTLDRPYEAGASKFAKELWNRYADLLAPQVLAGAQATSPQAASEVYAKIELIAEQMHEEFGPVGQPTFEGREIALGPRAGNYYLVEHGLREGESVVTQGTFKIDAEIQIQAKPSMMTPEGGGGGGHHHGGSEPKKAAAVDEHAGHDMQLPAKFTNQILELGAAFERLQQAYATGDVDRTREAFADFGQLLQGIDAGELSGHARMQWKEFSMLLGNDAFEGGEIKEMKDAESPLLALKSNMRRMRSQMGIGVNMQPMIERIAAPAPFQASLDEIWKRYLAIQAELANDQFVGARNGMRDFESALENPDASLLTENAKATWRKEKANLSKLVEGLRKSENINDFRAAFKPLAEEIGVLAKTFGFGKTQTVFELHCPMAFQNKGAVWYQDNDQVRNPYFGTQMLQCADRVMRLTTDNSEMPGMDMSHQDHSQH